MKRADARIAAPGEFQCASDTHPDHLIVEDIRRHADQGQIPPSLANDLMTRRIRDEVREALERDRVAIPDGGCDSLLQLGKARQHSLMLDSEYQCSPPKW